MDAARCFSRWSGVQNSEWANDWDFIPLLERNETIGVAAMRGSEIHFALDPTWRCRALQRGRLRRFLAPLLARHGYLTTTAMGVDRDQQQIFLERLGFEFTWAEPDRRHFMMTHLPFQREN